MLNVLLMRVIRGGWERCEVGYFLAESAVQAVRSGINLTIGHVDQEPTTAARNQAVAQARGIGAHVLLMVDGDMAPAPGFFKLVCRWAGERGPSNKVLAIGSPYRGGPPDRLTQVLDTNMHRIYGDAAAEKKGTELVRCVGTGLIAIDMRAFDLIEPPYFDYPWTSPAQDNVSMTEDFYFTDKLYRAGGLVACASDHWSGHAKEEVIGRP